MIRNLKLVNDEPFCYEGRQQGRRSKLAFVQLSPCFCVTPVAGFFAAVCEVGDRDTKG